MKLNIAKYFWDLNESALRQTKEIIKNPRHPKFKERFIAFLSRCDKPKELFSLISEREFVAVWPGIKKYWLRISRTSDFRDWWQTIYEEILRKSGIKDIKAVGAPCDSFLKIGKMIKTARIKKGLSQNDLAIRIGARQPDISNIEEGKKNITLQTLVRLARALGIKNVELEK